MQGGFSADSCVILQLQLFGQLLPQQVGQFGFECYPLVQKISLQSTAFSALGGGLAPA
jgi:hypothetical protein